MSTGLIMLTVLMLFGVIGMTVRVGFYHRRKTVGKYWLNLIDTWARINPVCLFTSKKNIEDDSKVLIHLIPCENVILKESDPQRLFELTP
jgi:hypothetical protein